MRTWQQARDVCDARIKAGLGLAKGKIVEVRDVFALLEAVIRKQILLAGYSVGEMAAWGVAELFDSATTLDLVALRAELMDTLVACNN
jgi:malonyl CoA-acyl carrier protein transacylase